MTKDYYKILHISENSTQEEINKVIEQKLEKRTKLHEMYAMQDFIFKPMEDNISEYQQEIMLAMQTPINQMIQLEKQYIEQQDMGNVGAAKEIRKRLENAREALYGVFDTWTKAIEDKFNIMDNYFAEMPVTNLQREQGERVLKALRNRELAKANQYKLNVLTEEYRGRTFRITKNEQEMAHWKDVQAQAERDGVKGNDTYVEAGKHIKELADDTQVAKFEMSELNRQIGDTDNLIRLEKELSKLPDLFIDAGNTAKKALEDGLVTFLTDGVNETGSLKDALLDLAKTFLKTMQEFFAKQMVTTMMNKLFGQYDTEGSGERNDLFKRATVPQEIATDNENVKKIVYFSGADSDIVGGELQVTSDDSKNEIEKLKQNGIEAKLNENGTGYAVQVDNNKASEWYTDYVHSNYSADDESIQQNDNNVINDQTTEITSRLDTIINIISGGTQDTISDEENNEIDSRLASGDYNKPETSIEETSTVVSGLTTSVESGNSTAHSDALTSQNTLSQILTELSGIKYSPQEVEGHATGGFIHGAGTSTSDSIPAMLSNGEFVVKASAVRKYGTGFLNAVNNGNFTKLHMPVARFADGGSVMREASDSTSRGIESFANNIGTNISNTNNISIGLVRDDDAIIANFLHSSKGQKYLLDFNRKNAKIINTF